jgi:hypothetical protein
MYAPAPKSHEILVEQALLCSGNPGFFPPDLGSAEQCLYAITSLGAISVNQSVTHQAILQEWRIVRSG